MCFGGINCLDITKLTKEEIECLLRELEARAQRLQEHKNKLQEQLDKINDN
jgi:hypothetical protein